MAVQYILCKPSGGSKTSGYSTASGSPIASGDWADANCYSNLTQAFAAIGTSEVWLILAPGTYYYNGLYPGAAGAAGLRNKIIGDYANTYLNGATGYIKIDGSDQTNNGVETNTFTLVERNTWAYTDFSGVWFTGSAANYIRPHSGNVANADVTVDDCIFEGFATIGLSLGDSTTQRWTGGASIFTFNRSLIISHYAGTNAGIPALVAYLGNGTTMDMNRCYIAGGGPRMVAMNSNTASFVYTVNYNNCTMVGNYDASIAQVAVAGDGSTTIGGDYNLICCYDDISGAAGNLGTNSRLYLHDSQSPAAGTEIKSVPLLPQMRYLWPGSVAVDVLSAGIAGTDIHGTTVPVDINGGANDYDVGAQELPSSTRYPTEPAMKLPTAAGGGLIVHPGMTGGFRG